MHVQVMHVCVCGVCTRICEGVHVCACIEAKGHYLHHHHHHHPALDLISSKQGLFLNLEVTFFLAAKELQILPCLPHTAEVPGLQKPLSGLLHHAGTKTRVFKAAQGLLTPVPSLQPLFSSRMLIRYGFHIHPTVQTTGTVQSCLLKHIHLSESFLLPSLPHLLLFPSVFLQFSCCLFVLCLPCPLIYLSLSLDLSLVQTPLSLSLSPSLPCPLFLPLSSSSLSFLFFFSLFSLPLLSLPPLLLPPFPSLSLPAPLSPFTLPPYPLSLSVSLLPILFPSSLSFPLSLIISSREKGNFSQVFPPPFLFLFLNVWFISTSSLFLCVSFTHRHTQRDTHSHNLQPPNHPAKSVCRTDSPERRITVHEQPWKPASSMSSGAWPQCAR